MNDKLACLHQKFSCIEQKACTAEVDLKSSSDSSPEEGKYSDSLETIFDLKLKPTLDAIILSRSQSTAQNATKRKAGAQESLRQLREEIQSIQQKNDSFQSSLRKEIIDEIREQVSANSKRFELLERLVFESVSVIDIDFQIEQEPQRAKRSAPWEKWLF